MLAASTAEPRSLVVAFNAPLRKACGSAWVHGARVHARVAAHRPTHVQEHQGQDSTARMGCTVQAQRGVQLHAHAVLVPMPGRVVQMPPASQPLDCLQAFPLLGCVGSKSCRWVALPLI